jgi:hypothetical protein
MFFTRNRFDAASLSGGSWEATLPLTNLQDRKLSKVARSTDDANASTKLVADLGDDYYVRAVSLHKTNLSRAGRYRIRGKTNATQLAALTPTNLTAEYGLGLWSDPDYTLSVPANFDPDDWPCMIHARPNWASSDGVDHVFAEFYADASNYIRWGKDASGSLYCTVVADGTTKTATLALTFAADEWIFFGSRLNGGTLTVYADTDADGDVSDNTDTATSVPASTGASWTGYAGSDQAGTLYLRGYLNFLITNDGSSADPITDRFNAGAGMALLGDGGLLAAASGDEAKNATHLVLSVGGNADGSAVEMLTFQGASARVTNNTFEAGIASWTGGNSNRSQSSAQAKAGTYSLLVDPTGTPGYAVPSNSSAITEGKVYFAKGSIYPVSVAATASLKTWSSELPVAADVCTVADAWNDLAFAVRATGTTASSAVCHVRRDSDTNDFYADEVYAYELATVSASTSDDGYVEDSTWLDAYPEIYPAGVLAVGDPGYSDNKLAAEDYADGYRVDPIVHIVASKQAQHWSIEFDDTANADGYVQLGRVWIDYGYQTSQNMIVGAGLGWIDPSTRTETDGTDAIYDKRTPRRVYDFAFDFMGEDEAFVRLLEICRLGTTKQLLFVSDHADTYHMHRRSMLAVPETLSPLKATAAVFYDQAYRLLEEI